MSARPIAFEDYVRHDATALAAGVRNGDFTPQELVETAIARAEAVNPKINAVATALYDQGRAAAGQPTGRLAGIQRVVMAVADCQPQQRRGGAVAAHPGARPRGIRTRSFFSPALAGTSA